MKCLFNFSNFIQVSFSVNWIIDYISHLPLLILVFLAFKKSIQVKSVVVLFKKLCFVFYSDVNLVGFFHLNFL